MLENNLGRMRSLRKADKITLYGKTVGNKGPFRETSPGTAAAI